MPQGVLGLNLIINSGWSCWTTLKAAFIYLMTPQNLQKNQNKISPHPAMQITQFIHYGYFHSRNADNMTRAKQINNPPKRILKNFVANSCILISTLVQSIASEKPSSMLYRNWLQPYLHWLVLNFFVGSYLVTVQLPSCVVVVTFKNTGEHTPMRSGLLWDSSDASIFKIFQKINNNIISSCSFCLNQYNLISQISTYFFLQLFWLSKILLGIILFYQSKQAQMASKAYIHEKRSSSDQQQEIFVKNIQTGQAENSKELTRHHRSLIIDKKHNGKVWKNYLSSIQKMHDKLLELVIHKNHNELQNILIQYPIELSRIRYMDGWTLLHFAVGQGDYNISQTLLKFGIDIDLATTGMQRTALHEASLGNKSQLVRLLVQWGADPNLVDSDRNTAIHFAVDYGYEDIVKLILKSHKTVDLNIRNIMNMTTFNTCRNPDIFELLINYEHEKKKNTKSTIDTTTTTICQNQGLYESRLVIRNSDVLPSSTRADMVEKFLSLREAPVMEKKYSGDVDSIISQLSFQSLESEEQRLTYSRRKKRVGSYLNNKSILRSKRIASQNIGLVKQSIFMTYLQGKQNVDNFDILRSLGSGSFAEVFLVRRKQSSSLYALKKIDKKILIENNLKRYVQAEKQVLINVKHPFIIEAYSCLQDFTHLYLLIQFCEYGDLERFVRKQKLKQSIAKTYACQVALALQQIHQKGFLYRDLKVSNILIDRDGHLRLADFGLAKNAVSSDSFLGSVSYLPPEMLVEGDKKPHSKSIDWYLFGLFVYELLHGLPPFYCEERQEMQNKIRNEKPTFDQTISDEARQLITKLLQKDPRKRIQSLSQLKKYQWFSDINWSSILERKGQVMALPKLDTKELRRKEYSQPDQDKLIDEKIEWFQNWNYPKDKDDINS